MYLSTTLTKYLSALALLLASYVLFNYVAIAQPPAEPAATTDTAAPATDAGDEQEPVVAAPANQPFEDYEASEQISEDLSVAFPVDI
ncbi:hypothetical protein [Congregibacter sp.]|uniref:hypothetical protein n=1 Tax=Congregibacter sp. TaxID=2744308 RepID=UPI003F6C41FF